MQITNYNNNFYNHSQSRRVNFTGFNRNLKNTEHALYEGFKALQDMFINCNSMHVEYCAKPFSNKPLDPSQRKFLQIFRYMKDTSKFHYNFEKVPAADGKPAQMHLLSQNSDSSWSLICQIPIKDGMSDGEAMKKLLLTHRSEW